MLTRIYQAPIMWIKSLEGKTFLTYKYLTKDFHHKNFDPSLYLIDLKLR